MAVGKLGTGLMAASMALVLSVGGQAQVVPGHAHI